MAVEVDARHLFAKWGSNVIWSCLPVAHWHCSLLADVVQIKQSLWMQGLPISILLGLARQNFVFSID